MAKLFGTTSRRTYRAPRQRAGYSTTVKAKTRLKRWFKRGTKKLWRKTKMRIRRRWRQHQRKQQRQRATHNRQIARSRTVHPTPASTGDDTGTLPGQVKLPPPDGAIASCRRCSNEVQYNGGRGRWEHTGKGHAECFQPGARG
jgi:hypothetical protein